MDGRIRYEVEFQELVAAFVDSRYPSKKIPEEGWLERQINKNGMNPLLPYFDAGAAIIYWPAGRSVN